MQARNFIPDFSNNETFLYENNCNYDSYKLSYKFVYISFLSFRSIQKQESNFKHLGGLVTRLNIWFSVYSESRSTSMVCRIQQTFTKGFFYTLFLFVLYFLDDLYDRRVRFPILEMSDQNFINGCFFVVEGYATSQYQLENNFKQQL